MNLNPAQQQAVRARGNVLVVAGAGTGKTRTLVERCVDCLLREKPPISLEQVLMVTFTEAAAAEMRQRIRVRLEEEARLHPENERLSEQLALFETAHIGTLHSFCLKLVRQHFYELELDPQLAVIPEEEAHWLAEETLSKLFEEHYAGRRKESAAVQQLIQSQARGWDPLIRALVMRIHHYTQTLPDPNAWFADQVAMFAASTPARWEPWLMAAIPPWREHWLEVLAKNPAPNELMDKAAAALNTLGAKPSRLEVSQVLEKIAAAGRDCLYGKKKAWFTPLKELFEGADFLASVTRLSNQQDPLHEDWGWVRAHMTSLLELSAEFQQAFSESKRELAMVDFHDLEQCALRLLWDARTRQPTHIAREWRQRIRFVFVDEYQDINAAQDKIIEMLSRDGNGANRFLVGDVKQSIYRFRLANPRIFQGYFQSWRDGQGEIIPLVENFRSREGILNFINSLFGLVMRRELGGVEYDALAQLRFSGPDARREPAGVANSGPPVELLLRIQRAEADEEDENEELAPLLDLQEADKEARMVALHLRELIQGRHQVWDEETDQFRVARWGDIAILLRSPAKKAESYAKEFSRLNLPLQVARGGFYSSLEISDVLSLLHVLDNPLQDLPLLALLHSPLVGLTLDELATVRLAGKGPFWTALISWQEGAVKQVEAESFAAGPEFSDEVLKSDADEKVTLPRPASTAEKVARFLERFGRWRRLTRQAPLSRCLDTVLSETHYGAWLLTQPRGRQRHANLQRLLGLAQQFDQFQRQGLFRFLRFVEVQKDAETEPEVAPPDQENAVRLMSIHQAKGLEFPIVVVPDLGKRFNLRDLHEDLILDEEYGLCPVVRPPQTRQRYPSLPGWLARQRQTRELLGEELRLLYVATTRARDKLLLSGTVKEKKFNERWLGTAANDLALANARTYADWVAAWFCRNCSAAASKASEGQHALLHWTIYEDTDLAGPVAESEANSDHDAALDDPAAWGKLQKRLDWKYPFQAATRQPAKTSVSAMRRRGTASADGEAQTLFQEIDTDRIAMFNPQLQRPPAEPGRLTAAEIGSAHHVFLRFASLDRVGSLDKLVAESQRLREQGVLTADEAASLDLAAVQEFWNSELGRQFLAQSPQIRRELAFTARFSPQDLAALTGEPFDPQLKGELVVVQGAVDLALVLPKEIWLVDFKTDQVREEDLAARMKVYEPQLKVYAQALRQVYRRPVTAGWAYFLARRQAVSVLGQP